MDSRKIRKWHRRLAPIIFLPLLLTVTTGVVYRVANSWFDAPEEVGTILLYLHQGTFLGYELRVVYVILNGLGAIAMLFTGIYMTYLFSSRRNSKSQ